LAWYFAPKQPLDHWRDRFATPRMRSLSFTGLFFGVCRRRPLSVSRTESPALSGCPRKSRASLDWSSGWENRGIAAVWRPGPGNRLPSGKCKLHPCHQEAPIRPGHALSGYIAGYTHARLTRKTGLTRQCPYPIIGPGLQSGNNSRNAGIQNHPSGIHPTNSDTPFTIRFFGCGRVAATRNFRAGVNAQL